MRFYRYDDDICACGGYHLRTFVMVSETPCGYWIQEEFNLLPMGYLGSEKKWMKKHASKKFAYTSEEEALATYYRRKKNHLSILESRYEQVKNILRNLEDTRLSKPHEVNYSISKAIENIELRRKLDKFRNDGFIGMDEMEIE